MISANNTWTLWSIILFIATFSIYLEHKYEFAAKISGAIIALILSLALSNLNIIPIDSSVYDAVWSYVVPISIPLLLFNCNLVQIYKESGRLLIIFLVSSFGTMLGSIVSYFLLAKHIPQLNKLSGLMTASYIGGGVNFLAVSTSLNIDPKLVSATIVSDNLLMVLYFFVLILIPSLSFVNKHFIRVYNENENTKKEEIIEAKTYGIKDIALSFTISVIIVAVSFYLSDILSKFSNLPLINLLSNKYLILTTITVILATVFSKEFKKIKIANELGTFLIYIFFVTIGIPASISSIIKNSPLLLVFCLIIVLVNMLVTFSFAKIFKFSLEEAILASNANIGGPTTAVAMAISKSWNRFVAPVMLVGTLGYVLGNFFGLYIAMILTNF